jgi:hypothetical protein
MKNDYLVETMDKSFYEFMCTRQDSIHQTNILKDKRYKKVNSNLFNLFLKIHDIIPKDLSTQLDNLVAEEASIREDYMYRQGFFDGLRLAQIQNEPIKYKSLEDEDEDEAV